MPLTVCFCSLDQVVVKTKTEYEPDRKKGKARPPKIAEFTVSITEGVTERFKVSSLGAGELPLSPPGWVCRDDLRGYGNGTGQQHRRTPDVQNVVLKCLYLSKSSVLLNFFFFFCS